MFALVILGRLLPHTTEALSCRVLKMDILGSYDFSYCCSTPRFLTLKVYNIYTVLINFCITFQNKTFVFDISFWFHTMARGRYTQCLLHWKCSQCIVKCCRLFLRIGKEKLSPKQTYSKDWLQYSRALRRELGKSSQGLYRRKVNRSIMFGKMD